MEVFPVARTVEAFQYMQRGSHMGKILIEVPESAAELPGDIAHLPFSLSSDAAYLLVGGLGGAGQAVATWMMEK